MFLLWSVMANPGLDSKGREGKGMGDERNSAHPICELPNVSQACTRSQGGPFRAERSLHIHLSSSTWASCGGSFIPLEQSRPGIFGLSLEGCTKTGVLMSHDVRNW